MNILLMSMPDISPGYSTNIITTSNLALISLAGNLDKKHNVKIVDLITKRKNIKAVILAAINMIEPDVVGLSSMTFQYNTALKIAKFIKNCFPDIKTALGGYHATLMYREIANNKDGKYFDLIFRGESDLSFNETMNKIQNRKDLKTVNGLSFKQNGKFIHNKKRNLEDLNQIKLPDRSARIWNECNILKLPFDLIEFSRGCLMSCKFCCIRSMYERSFRTYETQRVIKDIENAKRAGTRIMLFTDDNITLDVQKFENLCDEIIKYRHNDIMYGVQASSAGISSSQNLVKKMSQAGFKYVFLGIENASKKNLKELNKGDIVEKSRQAVKLLQENGIVIGGGFIIGNPDDNYESIEETFKFARDLRVDFSGVQFLVPYPKTKIREELLEKDLIFNKDNYKLYNGHFAASKTKYLNEDELNFIRFKLIKKYFKTRGVNTFKAIMKHDKSTLKHFKGLILFIPALISFLLFKKIQKLFMSEKKVFNRQYQKELRINDFKL